MTHPTFSPSPTPRGRHRRTNWLTQETVYALIHRVRPDRMYTPLQVRLHPNLKPISHAVPDEG